MPRAQDVQGPAAIRPDEWPTFRAGTRLATIDAVVVDDQGRQVTDLKPSDFEIVERGAKPKIHQALYVRVGVPGGAPAMPLPPAGDAATPPRARPLATGAIAATGRMSTAANPRVLAIVVDDLGLSFESTASVRTMLTRYVDTQVEPGDLVAIIRTAGGVGTLQQFTTDRRLLHAAVDRVRYTLNSRSGVGAFKAVEKSTSLFEEERARIRPGDASAAGRESATRPDISPLKQDADQMKAELTSAGTLGALEYVLRGIEALPGRKSVVFVSEGFDLGIRDAKAGRVWNTFTRVMDRANRSGVVVYSIDARSLQTGSLNAEDNPQTWPQGAGVRCRPSSSNASGTGASIAPRTSWTRRSRWSTWPSRPEASRSSTPTTWATGSGASSTTRAATT